MSIFPKDVFKGTNSDGSKFTMERWDFNDYADLKMFQLLLIVVGALLISSIASAILLIICVVDFGRREKLPYVFGIVLSIYILIDNYNDWLAVKALNMFCDESTIKYIVFLNIGTLIAHIILLLWEVNIYEHLQKFDMVSERKSNFAGYIVAIVVTTVILSNIIHKVAFGGYKPVQPTEQTTPVVVKEEEGC